MTTFNERLEELTPEQRELFELFLRHERLTASAAATHRAPGDPTEAALVRIWRDLLGVTPGVDDNYFELGGDSIAIIRMVAQARAEGVELRTEWVFSHPTIAGLAALSRWQQPAAVASRGTPIAWQTYIARSTEADPEFRRWLERQTARPVDAYPLSPSQQGLLYHLLARGADGCYAVQWRFTVRGTFDVARFAAAWQRVIARHEVFRTIVHWVGLDEPVQIVLDRAEGPIVEEVDAGGPARLADVWDEERRTPFDLQQAPLMRIRVLRVAEREWQCVWTHHHLILDGWSQQIFLRELFAAYRGLPLPPPQAGVLRDAIHARATMDDEAAAAFWRRELDGYQPAPSRVSADPAMVHRVSRHTIPGARRLREALRREAVTLSVFYETVWALLLSRLTGRSDVVFGVACSGRSLPVPGITDAVGPFVNTLPQRCRLDSSLTFRALLAQMQAAQGRLVAHEWCSAAAVQRWIGKPRAPLLDSLYVAERFPIDLSALAHDEGTSIVDVDATTHEHYPLVCVMQDDDESTTISLKRAGADDDVLRRDERLVTFFTHVVSRFLETPDLTVSDLVTDLEGLDGAPTRRA